MSHDNIIQDSNRIITEAFASETQEMFNSYIKCAHVTEDAIKKGNKILLCGNGGSCSTAAHITNDFISHMLNWQRNGYPAISFTDSGVITAIANDYGFEKVFERQVNALGKQGDVLWCFSTSGNSKNVILAVKEAKKKEICTVVFSGKSGGKLKDMCDIWCPVNTDDLIAAEAMHLYVIHSIAKVIEADLR